jgi:hypothetical protein
MRTNAPESYADRCRAALGAAVVEVTAERVPALIEAAWTAGRRAEDFAPFALATVRAERAAAAAPPSPAPSGGEAREERAAGRLAVDAETVVGLRVGNYIQCRNTLAHTAPRRRSTCHRDGTATIWDVYAQRWRVVAHPRDAAVAALGSEERARVLRHLARGAR